jgi:hypothetical protein
MQPTGTLYASLIDDAGVYAWTRRRLKMHLSIFRMVLVSWWSINGYQQYCLSFILDATTRSPSLFDRL